MTLVVVDPPPVDQFMGGEQLMLTHAADLAQSPRSASYPIMITERTPRVRVIRITLLHQVGGVGKGAEGASRGERLVRAFLMGYRWASSGSPSVHRHSSSSMKRVRISCCGIPQSAK